MMPWYLPGGSMRNLALNRQDDLQSLLERLSLGGMAATCADLALKAAKEGLSQEAYLYELAQHELELRRERRVERLLSQSWVPREKTFRTLDLDRFPAALRLQVERLKSGVFASASDQCGGGREAGGWEKSRRGGGRV